MPPRYATQRAKRKPPTVDLPSLRAAAGLTIDDICTRVKEISGRSITRGAVSAIELGHRGASVDTLAALAQAYGIEPGVIAVSYTPRKSRAAS